MLDLACGTGAHLQYFQAEFECTGVDLSPELLEIAGQRLRNFELIKADMREVDLGKQFDAVTCMFGAIAYCSGYEELERTASRIGAHLRPGGLAIVEPWLSPSVFKDGYISMLTVDKPDLKVARITRTQRTGSSAILHMEYLVADSVETSHLSERHRLSLFTVDEYTKAFEEAGMHVDYDPRGPMGRGLFVCEAG